MSANTILGFIAGVVVGALAALLLAPKSGEELRADMARQAQMERDRLQKEYKQVAGDLHDRMDKMQADVQTTKDTSF